MRKIRILAYTSAILLGSTALAHADPITTAIFGAAFASTFLGSVVSLGITVALEFGASLLINAVFGNQAQQTQTQSVGVQAQLQVGGDNPLSFPLGPAATAGLLTYAGTWGNDGDTPNAYLTQVFALSDLPVTGQPAIWVNDQKCTIDWDATPTDQGYPVTEYRFGGKDYLWVRWHDGTDTEADSLMLAKFGSDPNNPYDSDMIGTGRAYAVVTALEGKTDNNGNVWAGAPSFLFELPSIAFYDVRKDTTAGGSGSHRWDDLSTWEASDNPMVQAYNVARGIYYGSEWVFGGQNWPAFRLPAAVWMAAMNECDAAIVLAAGGTEPQFRAGAMVSCDANPTTVMQELLKACSGRIAEVGGVYKVLVGAPGAAVYSFTDSDIVVTKEQGYAPFPGLDSTQNAVTATYTEPAEKWGSKDAPPLYNAGFEADDDSRRLPVNIDFPAVQSNTQVQRLMTAALADARRFAQHQFYLGPYAWLLEPLDTVSWTSTRNGYEDKQFLLSSIEGEPGFLQNVAIKEIDPSDYDWTPATQEQAFSVGTLVTARPAPQLIADFAVSPATFSDNSGVGRKPGIAAAWRGGQADVRAVLVMAREKISGNIEWSGEINYIAFPSGGVLPHAFIGATTYQVQGRYLSYSGRATTPSDWLDVTTPDIRVAPEDLGAELRADRAFFQDALNALQNDLTLLSAVVQDALGINYQDKRVVLASVLAKFNANQASIQSVAETAASESAAAASLATAAQATADKGTASGIFEIQAQSTPDGVSAQVGASVSADDGATFSEAHWVLGVNDDGSTFMRLTADTVEATNSAGTYLWKLDLVNGNSFEGSV